MVHLLFGGTKTKPQRFKIYRIYISNLNGTNKCDFVALQQDIIYQDTVRSMVHGIYLRKKIYVWAIPMNVKSPFYCWVNVAGKIFNNKILQINQGITILETKFEWTILSKDIDDNNSTDITLTIISMFTQETSKNISDLWRLDVLSITDLIKSITKEVHQVQGGISWNKDLFKKQNPQRKSMKFFYLKKRIIYLYDNRDIAEKRLKSSLQRDCDKKIYLNY